MTGTNTRQDVTIEICHGRMMTAALGDLRSGGDKAAAIARVGRAISQASEIPAATWQEAASKGAMVRITLTGANASASRRMMASIERDLENLPPKGG